MLARPALSKAVDHVVCAHYPPLMIDSGSRPGSSVEILQAAAGVLGRRLEIQFLPFRRALKTLQKRPDILQPALYLNPTRRPHYTWVSKTHEVQNVFNTLHTPVDSLGAARKLDRIAVETDAAMDVLLSRQGFGNLYRVDKPAVSAEQLMKGYVDAWALTRSLASWTWSLLDYNRPLIHGAAIETADVYLVASKNASDALVQDYAGAVEVLRRKGDIARILASYESAS